jgi:CDP-glucose 4,6-dehydratase
LEDLEMNLPGRVHPSFWRGKKVFLTGHTGFKGAWLSIWLHAMGARVTGYSLLPPTKPSLFSLARVGALVRSVRGDVRDLGRLARAVAAARPEIVFHMAAQPLVRASYKDPVETYGVNVMGTVHLLESIRRVRGVRAVVNVTTDKCYENREWVWGYREDEPMGGYDPYSNSKGCSELLTSSYRRSFFNHADFKNHGVALASARAGNVIGGGDWASDRLIPDCIRALLAGRKIRVRSPLAIRPWQHVLEPLSGYLVLAQRLHEQGPDFAEGWNFGPDEGDSKPVGWIVDKMCSLWGNGASYAVDRGRHPHEANHLKLDCSKAKARLGWRPRWTLETALDKIIEWTKAHQAREDVRAVCRSQIQDYCSN